MRSCLLAVTAAVALTALAPTAHAGTGEPLLRYLPDGASQVIVIDVAHARSGLAVPRLVAQLRAHSPRWDAVAGAGVDLAEAIDTLVAGATSEGAGERHTVVVVDGKLGALLAHLTTPTTPQARHAGVTVWTTAAGELAVLDHHLVITSPGDMAATIDRSRRRAPRGERGAELQAVLGVAAGSGADLWGGLVLQPQERAQAAQLIGGEPAWIGFALSASARVRLDLQIALVDATAATAALAWAQRMLVGPDAQLASMLQAAGLGELAESISVEQDGSAIHLSGATSMDAADWLGNVLGSGM